MARMSLTCGTVFLCFALKSGLAASPALALDGDASARTGEGEGGALRRQAESGDRAAQLALGTRLMESADDARAAEGIRWLEKAALQGAPVYVILGDAYKNGVGVSRDMIRAARWYELGAEMGDGLAQFEMAKLYLTGTGVETDIVKAVLYLKLADKRVYHQDQRREITDLLKRARWWTSWEEWKRVERLLAEWEPKSLQDLLN